MSEAQDALSHAWKRLSVKWEKSADEWHDPVRDRFEGQYWQPLERELQATLKEGDRLNQVMQRVRREVQ